MADTDTKIRILIVDDDVAEVDIVKSRLKKDMRFPWSISHCVSLEEAKPCINKADLVILKPEVEDFSSPEQVFQNIEDMVFEVPVLVLTSAEDEHALSTYVLEHGAADTVVRGQFARLAEAIEFALIRQRHQTGARKNADRVAADKERQRQILRMFCGDYAVDQQDKTKV